LQATEAVEQRFLLHLLNATDLMPYVNGTTRLKLTQADMRRIPVPLPPLVEQRRIVARIEALFARTRRARTDLERIAPLSAAYRCSAMEQAFSADIAECRIVPLGSLLAAIEAGKNMRCEERQPRAGENGIVKISAHQT
jgi:type I restriction enzyme S subunit